MSKGTSLLLIVWNVVLSALLGWALMRKPGTPTTVADAHSGGSDSTAMTPMTVPVARDTAGLKNGRVAYYQLDSVESRYALIKESKDRVQSEGKRLQGNLEHEMTKAQNRYEELMKKDHTYSTKAELEADQAELEGLQQHIGELRSSAQDQLDQLQYDATEKINGEIVSVLEEYNKTAGFDYIISVQKAGQIWAGNKGLDVTEDIIQLLNARHKAGKK